MKRIAIVNSSWSRYGLAVLSGLLLAASFPKWGVAGFAWIAPACIVFAAMGTTGGEAFRIGYLAGLTHYLASLYWLLFIPFRVGPVPVGPILGWLALSAYLAAYSGLWVWFCWRICPSVIEERNTTRPAPNALLKSRWIERAFWIFLCAAAWVALEMVLARFLTGFPWNLLGVSQYRILPVIQIASVTGVYGVSFVVVWFSLALACAAIVLIDRPASRRAWLSELALPLIAVVSTIVFGSTTIRQNEQHKPDENLEVTLIQPSIPQTLIWDTNKNALRFSALLDLTEEALEAHPTTQLLIWPEAAVPSMLRYDAETFRAVSNLVEKHDVWMVLGADDAELRTETPERYDADYYNSSFLMNSEGRLLSTYRKRRLVVFGEFLPLVDWLPFLRSLIPIGNFTPGDAPVQFRLSELGITTSVLICFEDNFPHLVRDYVEPETNFLINLTNNGWFGESAAQWQHAANSVFRAVEHRRPLVRCTNNGLTCWIDSRGGMHIGYFGEDQDVYSAGFMNASIPVTGPAKRELTFYTRYGDLFGWTCVGIAVAALAIELLRRPPRLRRGKRGPLTPR